MQIKQPFSYHIALHILLLFHSLLAQDFWAGGDVNCFAFISVSKAI